MFGLFVTLVVLLNSSCSRGQVELALAKGLKAKCDEETTVQCHVTSSPVTVVNAFWTKKEDAGFYCDALSDRQPTGTQCDYANRTLTLTLSRPRPAHMGTYVCCVQTTSGHGKQEIRLSMDWCEGRLEQTLVGSEQMRCTVRGVYPHASINWFDRDRNVTSRSVSTRLRNPDGTFSLTSLLSVQHPRLHQYNCSLQTPGGGGRGRAVGGASSRASDLSESAPTALLLALVVSGPHL